MSRDMQTQKTMWDDGDGDRDRDGGVLGECAFLTCPTAKLNPTKPSGLHFQFLDIQEIVPASL